MSWLDEHVMAVGMVGDDADVCGSLERFEGIGKGKGLVVGGLY